jgi:hypothetical protein
MAGVFAIVIAELMLLAIFIATTFARLGGDRACIC